MNRFTILGTLAVTAALPALAAPLASGLKPGERVSPFHPQHIAGPLAGTSNCFPCTFQNRPQVQVWINGDNSKNALAFAGTLSKAMKSYQGKEFKGLVVFVTTPATEAAAAKAAKMVSESPTAAGVGVALIDAKNEAITDYKINTDADVKNTVFAYKNWEVKDKFVNLQASTDDGRSKLEKAIAGIAK
jgi:hypothetical protein